MPSRSVKNTSCHQVVRSPRHAHCPFLLSDKVISENPASRGTETSAEVLVGPPWRMESNAGQQQWYEGGHPL